MNEIKVPELAESITEGTIAEWLVKKGDKVEKGDPIVELETDKVNVEVNSEYSGVITEIIQEEGDDVEVGDVIAKIDENAEAGSADAESAPAETKEEKQAEQPKEPSKQETKEETKEESGEETTTSGDVIASPAARKRARELNIDLRKVSPRDPLGRIRPEDVEAASKDAAKPTKPKEEKKPAEKTEFDKPVERIKMSRRRQTIAKRLVEVQQEAAMLTTFNEVDLTNVMKLRSERKEKFIEKHGVKLGFMSFFTKAVVGALKDFPLLNAEIQGNEIVMKKFYDIGIAVSTEEGLVVPVVRDADRLDFAGVEKEIGNLSKKARDKKLTMSDLQGGSFTITNGGTFGSMLSTPILNAPQVGILGMHNIQKRAVVMPDDSIEVRPMMYLALSYDHRIVDGKEAVQFLVRVKQLLEDPYDLLLEG
ncbi:dihydrolipoyllysine-residue succinyltransferase component of 2-oxoglutarate dehydrogenase complex [Virgibacillus pantothenticus]|uniref:Dihydrolipoyllysine-residue succinyltransferase component of 2-oxoglutarate dehydrogenase complex n=1 Tax=Virgibacillus pantothenticus TaxID=1473 RepID=A0A0L0QUN6_VIRPA|nr:MULTISPECIES: 2-oxoglutarate dehydrogenase complex dihydrolipoyllysine-residue succinyltransferase [Virgibacillus]API91133.1 dihydrolipoamide succinyltransferase [Virgibacillus sp. 6R]KNE21913.1 dihydrolipoamide succinyltransferase [Virgibacillus pantothenticus]MBS7429122.1 2-oxoglutarate dehydrogenase complex dihydrolipoyllysine-residue succinyltransferase [Virgibacillus sp. 19R1-5]MBU8566850.1 2-oxoglutarate dehydrogenase complex dihydrolipoyllysine-residue succinyltransferase [Virgibacill